MEDFSNFVAFSEYPNFNFDFFSQGTEAMKSESQKHYKFLAFALSLQNFILTHIFFL